jgi:transposase-like protein
VSRRASDPACSADREQPPSTTTDHDTRTAIRTDTTMVGNVARVRRASYFGKVFRRYQRQGPAVYRSAIG